MPALDMDSPIQFENLFPRVRGIFCAVPGCGRLLKNSTGYNLHLSSMHPGYHQADAEPTFLMQAGLTFPGPASLRLEMPGSPLVHASLFDRLPSTPTRNIATSPLRISSGTTPAHASLLDHTPSTPEIPAQPVIGPAHVNTASVDEIAGDVAHGIFDGLEAMPYVTPALLRYSDLNDLLI